MCRCFCRPIIHNATAAVKPERRIHYGRNCASGKHPRCRRAADRAHLYPGGDADYDDLKAKAAQFDAAQEAGKTELQKANEKAAKLQQQLDALNSANTLREVRAKVSAATGVPADLLSGDTEEACTAQAQAILKFAKPGYPNVRDGGDPHHTPTCSTRQQFADWFEQVTK